MELGRAASGSTRTCSSTSAKNILRPGTGISASLSRTFSISASLEEILETTANLVDTLVLARISTSKDAPYRHCPCSYQLGQPVGSRCRAWGAVFGLLSAAGLVEGVSFTGSTRCCWSRSTSSAPSESAPASTACSRTGLRGPPGDQGDPGDPRLHGDAGPGHAVGDRSPQAPRLRRQAGRSHSPHAGYDGKRLGALRGFVHAHVGWLFTNLAMERARSTAGICCEDRLVVWIDRLYLRLGRTRASAIPFAIGYAVVGSLKGALAGLVWGGLLRIFLYQHATFSVNSVCHLIGRRSYPTRDRVAQQPGRGRALLRRGLAQQPPRLPGLTPARFRGPGRRPHLVAYPGARRARSSLESACAR